MSDVSVITSLYRQILRVHRAKLPPAMRVIGDGYAKHEFKSHLQGRTTMPQWAEFVKQWKTYTRMLEGQESTSSV